MACIPELVAAVGSKQNYWHRRPNIEISNESHNGDKCSRVEEDSLANSGHVGK